MGGKRTSRFGNKVAIVSIAKTLGVATGSYEQNRTQQGCCASQLEQKHTNLITLVGVREDHAVKPQRTYHDAYGHDQQSDDAARSAHSDFSGSGLAFATFSSRSSKRALSSSHSMVQAARMVR